MRSSRIYCYHEFINIVIGPWPTCGPSRHCRLPSFVGHFYCSLGGNIYNLVPNVSLLNRKTSYDFAFFAMPLYSCCVFQINELRMPGSSSIPVQSLQFNSNEEVVTVTTLSIVNSESWFGVLFSPSLVHPIRLSLRIDSSQEDCIKNKSNASIVNMAFDNATRS